MIVYLFPEFALKHPAKFIQVHSSIQLVEFGDMVEHHQVAQSYVQYRLISVRMDNVAGLYLSL